MMTRSSVRRRKGKRHDREWVQTMSVRSVASTTRGKLAYTFDRFLSNRVLTSPKLYGGDCYSSDARWVLAVKNALQPARFTTQFTYGQVLPLPNRLTRATPAAAAPADVDEAEVNRIVSALRKDGIIKLDCDGPLGTVYIFDNNGVHRLHALPGTFRALLQNNYTPGNSLTSIIERRKTEVTDRATLHPSVFDDIDVAGKGLSPLQDAALDGARGTRAVR